MRGGNLTYQAASVDVVYSTWTEHLGSHDYLSMNEKLLIKYEYMYHVGVLLKFCLEKISSLPHMSSLSLWFIYSLGDFCKLH